MSTYKSIKLEDDSYKAIQELYLRSFGLKATIDEIKKKYNTAPFGMKNLGYISVAEDGDLAAYYGAFPMRMTIDGKDYLVAQSGDTMTAPEHRKKGLFTILAKEAYKLAEESGIHFVFGFPNDNSYPGFVKNLNWKFYGAMKNLNVVNKVLPLCELSVKFKWLYPAYLSLCKCLLKKHRIEATEENIRVFNENNTRGFVKKDTDFFNYKLANKNIFLIKIKGYTLLIKPDPHLMIGAVGHFEKEKVNEFLSIIKKLASKLGCKKTIFTLSGNHWLFDYLKDKVSVTDTLQIGYYEINKDVPYAEISYTGADYDTF